MSGIIGYIGGRKPVPILLDGLRRMEYRGYDSAGLAVVSHNGVLSVRRAVGRVHHLDEAVRLNPADGWYGIGHTRWATHGRPSVENTHPHVDARGDIAVVHNGIVENYLELKHEFEAAGRRLRTETDTEIIPNLVASCYGGNLEDAVRAALPRLRGPFAIAVISRGDPGKIVAARNGPPIVIGLGEREYFLSSDVTAILNHTSNVFFLEDGDIAILTPDGVRITDFGGRPVGRQIIPILRHPVLAEKGGYSHYTQKEIYEQPRAVRDTLAGRIDPENGRVYLDELQLSRHHFAELSTIRLVACGTSWHAALAAKFMFERLARLPVEVDYSSEFRYRDPVLAPGTLTVVVSQSGETADTLAALREARLKGSRTLAVTNAIESMIAREADAALSSQAGPEIGVASTKTFTAQLAALCLLAMYTGQSRGSLQSEESLSLARELLLIPGKLETLLSRDAIYETLVAWLAGSRDFLFLGRGIHYPVALEGALKLKEISYIHAEGYPAGEMKHGPNALIDELLPTVVLAAMDPAEEGSRVRYLKTLSTIQEVKARGGKVIAVATDGSQEVAESADKTIFIPPSRELLLPLLEVVPLQLLAYHFAVHLGRDVDQPRNLAKSVTVE
jgi:glucosamine--fructose-6-phosphate aminotransferase (isomerizing)